MPADMIVRPMVISSIRIRKPMVSARTNQNSTAHRYIRPSRLWSWVNSQALMPVSPAGAGVSKKEGIVAMGYGVKWD